MTAIKNLLNSGKSLNVSTNKADVITDYNSYPKSSLEVAMLRHEAIHKLEQNYYNKASGCSVKAQKDNLFDYSALMND